MVENVSRADVAREEKRRRRCRESLHSFALNIDIPTAPTGAICPEEEITGPAAALMARHHAAILSVCERTIKRPFGRALIMAPPGTAKSTYVSVVTPPWAMGRIPGTRIILTSYASALAYRQSRRGAQIINSDLYRNIWDDKPLIVKDSDPERTLSNGSEILSAGLTAGITGNRANGAIIDDPVAGREEADSPAERRNTLDAYQDDLLTRLLPGAWLIIIMCMTGDTKIAMADGTEKELRIIVPGDRIKTYEDGRETTTTVLQHKSQGEDAVFELCAGGRAARANARHPFLAERDGRLEWVRLKHLCVGDRIVVRRQSAGECAGSTTPNGIGATENRQAEIRRLIAQLALSTGTAFWQKIITLWSQAKKGYARFAESRRRRLIRERIGAENFASTTTTRTAKLGGCSATIATYPLDTVKPPKCSNLPLPTSDFELAPITNLRCAGREEVFDIQVERTENFIANGIVSHNTRWNEQDLGGEILPHDYKGESGIIRCRDGMDWEVLNLQAKCEHADDPLGRQIGEYIWTDYYPERHWKMFENGIGPTRQRTWASLYQQRPTPQGSGQFTREMIQYYDGPPPATLAKVICSDWAVTAGKNDFTEHGIWGIDSDDTLYAVDWWHKQADTGESTEKMLEMVSRHDIHLGFNEGGVIDKAVRPMILTRIRDWNATCQLKGGRRIFLDLRALPSMQDKMAKLSSFQGRTAIGKVKFPRNAPWTERVIDQLLAMPSGRWDDAADVCGLAGRGLDQYHPPRNPEMTRKQGIKPFTAEWLEYKEEPKVAIRYR